MRYPTFEKLKNNEQRQRELGLQLLRAAKISTNIKDYGIEELEIMQKYYDKLYPNMYRIIAFSEESAKMPIWFKKFQIFLQIHFRIGPNHRRQYNVVVYLKDGHWNAIKHIESFFRFNENRSMYCADCADTYINPINHGIDCPAR